MAKEVAPLRNVLCGILSAVLALGVNTDTSSAQVVGSPSEITLSRAPIHGVELGMRIEEAFEVLASSGFVPGDAYIPPANIDVRSAGGNFEQITYSQKGAWFRDGIRLELQWTGVDPRREADRRRFDEDGRVWFISRSENLADPSTFDVLFLGLQERFGFESVLCMREGGLSTFDMTYAVHVTASGNADGVILPDGMQCTYSIGQRDLFTALNRHSDFSNFPDTSLNLEIRRNDEGLVTFVRMEHWSTRFILEEIVRFYNATAEAIDSQGSVGSGLSDF